MAEQLINGLSVDVEDWFQVGAYEGVIDRASWDSLPSRIERNCAKILDMLAAAGVKATFFTLGWVARRHGPLMRRIVEAGHELASHGWDHQRLIHLDQKRFRTELDHSRKLLEDASGQRITGYRAPSFSIDQRTTWAYPVLAEQGFDYSSSVAPIAHDHYGWHEAERFAFRPLPESALIEIPVTTVQLAGRRLGAGGGGFFRVLPYAFSRWAISRVNRIDRRPAVFYFHPWEIDPDQPRVAEASLRSRFRHTAKLAVMAGKLNRLMSDFSWGRMDALASLEQSRAVPILARLSPGQPLRP